ncbi:MAG TPA: lamin tail domain-containing protein [Pyrinomonadaceae bacterium]|nr:lamin tail domain-containing protein [Pyrinomonadaceae bacterium]
MLRLIRRFLIAILVFSPFIGPRVESDPILTRLTNTAEHATNLNPTLSDSGDVVVFESSADLSGGGESSSFHVFRADLAHDGGFTSIASGRAISPAVSSDGRIVTFASTEDLVGENPDRNSEIFLFDGVRLKQLTHTQPASVASRLSDGNFQPSITPDGRAVAFSSNRDLTGQNSDLSYEIFLLDLVDQSFIQLTNLTNEHSATSPKISGDGSRVYFKRTTAATSELADLVLVETQTLTNRVVAADVAELTVCEGRAVSNDGMRLVYSALTAANQTQVFMFDARENASRQVTQLGSRVTDVKLQPTISGDGKRIAFATRRKVISTSDGGVELYLLDLPTAQVQQITNAPAAATAEVVSSLNFDGTRLAFSFPRILSGPVSNEDFRNNSEIYLASISARPEFGSARVFNAAAQGHEPQPAQIAPQSIAMIHGSALAFRTEEARSIGSDPPFELAGTTVKVNGLPAQIFYAAPDEVVFAVPNGLANGPAEFVVTNSEGFSSKAVGNISATAPGVFTVSADGRGDAIILNADTLIAGPFDPSNGQLRLSIFATGVAGAKTVSVTIRGRSATVETIAPSNLAGLNEIHVLVPAALSGLGKSTIVVTADGVQSNAVSVVIAGPLPTPTSTPTPASSPSPSPIPTPDVAPKLVISQIYGGGGNSGAPFRNDFIEIFNNGSAPVNLAGWCVQYASATASSWSVTPLSAVTLLPGQYYLIQESSGGSNGIALPNPDAVGTIAMAAGTGKVALVKTSTALSGTCPNDPTILDLVGYGSTANCFKGPAPAPTASNTNAVLRMANGCSDTQNNMADFSLGPPNPRNTNFLPRTCANP